MNPSEYWKGRWQRGETGWHQKEVEARLMEDFSQVKPTRVLVPLCGKSLDMAWLGKQGHEVIGIELSPLACEAFFQENQIPFQKVTAGDFTIYEGEKVKIYQGDFFKMTPEILGSIGAVYDRAALIALPREMRKSYSAHLIQLLRPATLSPDFYFLQIVLEKIPHDENGPPHSVSASEVEQLYGKDFQVQLLSRERVDPRGETQLDEVVLSLTPKKRNHP